MVSGRRRSAARLLKRTRRLCRHAGICIPPEGDILAESGDGGANQTLSIDQCHPAMIDPPWTSAFRQGSAPSRVLYLLRTHTRLGVEARTLAAQPSQLLTPEATLHNNHGQSCRGRRRSLPEGRMRHALSCKPWHPPCLVQSPPIDLGQGVSAHYNGPVPRRPFLGLCFLLDDGSAAFSVLRLLQPSTSSKWRQKTWPVRAELPRFKRPASPSSFFHLSLLALGSLLA
jgi:hypothetical protein